MSVMFAVKNVLNYYFFFMITCIKLESCFVYIMCFSMPGYGHETGPALQPGKPL